jgi:hypothetical protein
VNAIDDCYHGGVDWSDGGTCRRLGFGFGSNASSMAKGHDHVIAHAGVQQIDADHGLALDRGRWRRQCR